jgi:phosphohistidine phosphatase
MTLYLVRHAIAVARTYPPLMPDAERTLTDVGIEKMVLHARALVRLGEQIEVILTSPYARARQTAEILAEPFEPRPLITIESGLTPGCDGLSMLRSIIGRYANCGVALVGHEPDMSEMAAALISNAADAKLEFKKGAVCRIDLRGESDPLEGRLRWLLAPKQLRLIARG